MGYPLKKERAQVELAGTMFCLLCINTRPYFFAVISSTKAEATFIRGRWRSATGIGRFIT